MTRRHFFLLNLYHILIDGLYDSIPILLTFIILHFGGDESRIGYIVSCGSFLGAACGLCTPFFATRLEFTRLLGLTALLYGIGFFANGFSTGMLHTGVFFVLAVAGHNVFHNAAFAHISRQTDRAALGRTLSDFTAYGDVGRIPLTATAGYAAAFVIAGIAGWRIVCVLFGILILAVGIALIARSGQAKRDDRPKRILPSLAPARNPDLRRILCSSMLNAFGADHIFLFLPALLLFKGFDSTILGSLALGFTLGCFIGKTLCGRLIDKFGTRKVFIVSEAVLAVLLVLMVRTTSLYPVLLLALLIGIVSKGTVPVVQAMLTEPLADKEHFNDVFAINGLLRGGMNTLAPALFGLLASALSLDAAYLVMAVAALAAIAPVATIRKRET